MIAIAIIEQPSAGVITAQAGGSYRYEPPANFAGTASATYTISDGRGGADSATISFLVIGVNDAPIGRPDDIVLTSYLPQAIFVLANDSDVDGDVLKIGSVEQPQDGEATVVSNTIEFTPPSGWVGSTSFTYTVVDPSGASDEAVVTVTLPAQALAAAKSLSSDLGTESLNVDTVPPNLGTPAVVVTIIQGVNLIAKAFFQTIAAFQIPSALIGLTFLMFMGMGGATSVPIILARQRRRYWSVVMLSRETQLPVYAEPSRTSPVIYNFNPTTEGILTTGRPISAEDTQWMPVETTRGDGWVNAEHLTEQMDAEAFLNDARPAKLVRKFAERLREGRDISSLIASRGLIMALTGSPTLVDPEHLKSFPQDPKTSGLENVGVASHEEEDFRIAVAEPFLSAFDATPDLALSASHSKKALIPVEVWNFRYLALNGENTQPWLVFFEYEGGKPRIVGLGIDE